MDLYAYMQIEDLASIAQANGIEVPRLRGYRLMSMESSYSREKIEKIAHTREMYLCERGCYSIPRFRPDSNMTEFSLRTERVKKKYCVQKIHTEERDDGGEYSWEETVAFRWDLIHGKNRKEMKFAIKKGRRDVVKQLTVFNKYVGREDVLYIHARIGNGNWLSYGGAEIEKQPWFLEKVDDYFDGTYCDIYALIDPSKCAEVENDRNDSV